MLNVAVLMGRLVADPELRHTPNGIAVTTFTVAVDRGYAKAGTERQTDCIYVVAWRATAEFVCKYFRKGQMIAVEGLSRPAVIRTGTEISVKLLKFRQTMSALRNLSAAVKTLRTAATAAEAMIPAAVILPAILPTNRLLWKNLLPLIPAVIPAISKKSRWMMTFPSKRMVFPTLSF